MNRIFQILLLGPVLAISAELPAEVPEGPTESTGLGILVEFIRADMAESVKLITKHAGKADATDLRTDLKALIEKEEAELIDAAWVVARSGQRAKTEGIEEFISPTHFEPARLAEHLKLKDVDIWPFAPVPSVPKSWETRNVGVTLEVDPVLGANGDSIDLNLNPERVILDSDISYDDPKQRPNQTSNHRLPIFKTVRVTTSINTKPGEYALAGLARDPQDPKQRIFIFILADDRRVPVFEVEPAPSQDPFAN